MTVEKDPRKCSVSHCNAFRVKGTEFCFFHTDREKIIREKKEKEETEKNANIIECINSKFRHAFGKNLDTWKNWYSCLKTIYGIPMDDEEKKFIYRHTGRKEIPETGFNEIYFVAGRRSGKSKIAALIATYEAIYGDWQKYLTKGEKAYVFLICNDKMQSRVLFDYIRGYLQPYSELVEKEKMEEIYLKNEIIISVKTASFRSVRGFGCAAIICDELAFWRDSETSRNPASEIINSLIPTMFPESKLLGLSSPYGKFGIFWETYKQNYGNEKSDVLVFQSGTKDLNPTYHDSILKKFFKRDKIAFQSEYLAQFRSDISSFLDEEVLDEITENYIYLPPQPGINYFGFVDPSGGKSDSMTMCIAHRDGPVVVVDRVEERPSPIKNPKEIVMDFGLILREYRVSSIFGDRYSGNWCSGSFLENGISYVISPLDKNRIYIEALGLINLRTVLIPKNERMRNQFLGLERKTRSSGLDEISHPPGGHDDIANAVAGAITVAASGQYVPQEFWKGRMPVFPSKKENDKMSLEEEMREFCNGARIIEKKSINSWWTGQETK